MIRRLDNLINLKLHLNVYSKSLALLSAVCLSEASGTIYVQTIKPRIPSVILLKNIVCSQYLNNKTNCLLTYILSNANKIPD